MGHYRKAQLVDELRRYWPGGVASYIEPFAGSACLFFALRPSRAVLGDLNWELVCTMRAVREQVDRVLDHLARLPAGRDAYYKVRAVDPRRLAEIDIAARFLYLNRYCFNGLFRTNSEGHFNVPFGPPRSGRGADEQLIRKASAALREATIIQGDFEATLCCADRADFVYLDPPYAIEGRRVFREYLPGSFTPSDLLRLQLALKTLHGRGVKFVVTYADSLEARRLLAQWKPRRVRTRRNIAGFSGARRFCYELLASNFEVAST